jgi:8-oxo-dGTP diphosphatase
VTKEFKGAKLILFFGDDLLVIRRDDKISIPFPNLLDWPGGGREGIETPEECVLRETKEEIGIGLAPSDLVWKSEHLRPSWRSWFFSAHLPASAIPQIQFGDEGRGWFMIPPEEYLLRDDAIPHFQEQLNFFLDAHTLPG